jgi:hypothetical protein
MSEWLVLKKWPKQHSQDKVKAKLSLGLIKYNVMKMYPVFN